MIVTIDGPAGSGKSTAARRLAERLGYRFLDTGAMYRAVAWACLDRGVDLEEETAVAAVAESLTIEFPDDRVVVGGRDVTLLLRSPRVTEAASITARIAGVRDAMVVLQRQLAAGDDVVTEGRDQGTVVFPQAECKFFLTADAEVRARRRQQEMGDVGESASFEEILKEIRARDCRDETREVAPLRAAADAVRMDTSSLEIETVLDRMERAILEHEATG